MCIENQSTEDGEIKNNKQRQRVVMIDDKTWNLVLTKKEQKSISEYLRDLIKKEEEKNER